MTNPRRWVNAGVGLAWLLYSAAVGGCLLWLLAGAARWLWRRA